MTKVVVANLSLSTQCIPFPFITIFHLFKYYKFALLLLLLILVLLPPIRIIIRQLGQDIDLVFLIKPKPSI